jgi:molybdopterin molybdotransferase
MVNFHQFVRPWLLRSMGLAQPFLPVVDAIATEGWVERPGRATLVRVTLAQHPDGVLRCAPTGTQSSGALGSMARAHGLLLVAATRPGVAAGDRVRVQLLDPSFLDRSDPGYGW